MQPSAAVRRAGVERFTIGLRTRLGSRWEGEALSPDAKFRALAASGDPTVWGPNDADMLLRWFYYGDTWTVNRYHWDAASIKKCADLIDQAAKAKDEATQKSVWKQVLDLIADEVPLYPIFHAKIETGFDANALKNFHGLDTTGLDVTPETLQRTLEVDVEEWKNEIPLIEEWFDKIGAQLPTSMKDELASLKLRLNA